jgi:hypothetical protein
LDVRFLIGVKQSSTAEDANFFNLCVGKRGEDGCTPASDSYVTAPGDESGIRFLLSSAIIDTSDDIETEGGIMQIGRGGPNLLGLHGYTIYVCATETQKACTGANDPDYYGQYDFEMEVIN